ncbi:MAG: hypothetical protein GY719_31160 [bacterium]|nr:hypothetical protein [bacterium]
MSETELTLEEVARLADGGEVSVEMSVKLAGLIRRCPMFASQVAQLEAMAEVAGVGRIEEGLDAHRDLEVLLSEEWEHPGEVLQPGRLLYGEMIAVAGGRAREVEGQERERVLEVKRRLEELVGEGGGGGYLPAIELIRV